MRPAISAAALLVNVTAMTRDAATPLTAIRCATAAVNALGLAGSGACQHQHRARLRGRCGLRRRSIPRAPGGPSSGFPHISFSVPLFSPLRLQTGLEIRSGHRMLFPSDFWRHPRSAARRRRHHCRRAPLPGAAGDPRLRVARWAGSGCRSRRWSEAVLATASRERRVFTRLRLSQRFPNQRGCISYSPKCALYLPA